ncbi:hypothetical protein [Ruegeria arenilitoris]|uniref:hypothetical protein n=1 Tax=Ruegeria arenilitoris TaxID=1173585 RepID=UPI001480C3B8|nr:hypothetical protein [Ruegeria arenilitoris]
MRRVMLHLGFHKTGTTAAQSFLFENRELIWPQYALVLPFRTRKTGLADAATHFSIYGTHDALTAFSNQMRKMLCTLDLGARRGLILSEENFSGLRPSRNPAVGYEAAPDLAACLVGLIRNRFANERMEITLYLSLRRRSDWLRSLWAHDLRRTRLLLDFSTYQERLTTIQSPEDAANAIRDHLPNVDVRTRWLEDLREQPLGPGAPFAEFLGMSKDQVGKLVTPSHTNPALPDTVLSEMLALNRSTLDEGELFRQKKALDRHAQNDLIGTE